MTSSLFDSQISTTLRTVSLLHRLQTAPGAEEHGYVDQLMLFLDDPPPGIRDRWKEGAEMCGRWGVPCSGASVWRLYRSHFIEWRLRAMQEEAGELPTEGLAEDRLGLLIARRKLEILGNPRATANCLLSLARLELRQQALALARQKHQEDPSRVKSALTTLMAGTGANVDAQTLVLRIRDMLFPGQFPSEETVTGLRKVFLPGAPAPSAAVAKAP